MTLSMISGEIDDARGAYFTRRRPCMGVNDREVSATSLAVQVGWCVDALRPGSVVRAAAADSRRDLAE